MPASATSFFKQRTVNHFASDMKGHSKFEHCIGYVFRNRNLLEESLRHSSFINEHPALTSNERLEFLGDSVLSLVVSHLLMGIEPPLPEGMMTRLRAQLVNETTLAEIARKIDLGTFLQLGKGETQSNGRAKNSILADACEALIAAVYLDGGFDAAFRLVQGFIEPMLQQGRVESLSPDFKSNLQELLQATQKPAPVYRVIDETGPDHEKCFVVQVKTVDGETTGQGRNKKAAEQDAARNALRAIYRLQD